MLRACFSKEGDRELNPLLLFNDLKRLLRHDTSLKSEKKSMVAPIVIAAKAAIQIFLNFLDSGPRYPGL